MPMLRQNSFTGTTILFAIRCPCSKLSQISGVGRHTRQKERHRNQKTIAGENLMTQEQIAAAREWILDCQWEDLDEEDIPELSDTEVINGIARNYDGGIKGFILDGGF